MLNCGLSELQQLGRVLANERRRNDARRIKRTKIKFAFGTVRYLILHRLVKTCAQKIHALPHTY